MRSNARSVLLAACGLALATAVPVAISPTWGWLVALVVAATGGIAFARMTSKVYIEPMERLADVIRPNVSLPDASTEDLARLVAFEFRDAVAELERTTAGAARREAALSHSSDGAILVDADGLVEYANPSARSLMNERALDITRRLDQPELAALVGRAKAVDAPVIEEVTLRIPGPHPALARAVPLASGGCVVLVTDLTESHRLDQVRRDFVANVSHELKTPVAGIRALTEVAAQALASGDAETASGFLHRLETESERLSKLVIDLLDLSRVEGGHELEPTLLDLFSVTREAVDRTRPLAELKGLTLDVSGEPVLTEADAAQLGMAIQNLVDNAVRYSDAGTVRVEVSRRGEHAAVVVSDEGIGIPSQEVPRIFERFYRVDRARSRRTGGTGLGLSIVRHVAENHGGRIDVHSELGVGSSFTLLLPGGSHRTEVA